MRQRRQERMADDDQHRDGELAAVLDSILTQGVSSNDLHAAVSRLRIELVLTAHPTEIVRRTVAGKYQRIARLLAEQDRADLSGLERHQLKQALHRAVAEVWETDEIRRTRPTPIDEAKSGLVAVEQSLWQVIPDLLRELDQALRDRTDRELPRDVVPVTFGSWDGWRSRRQPECHARRDAPGVCSEPCAGGRIVLAGHRRTAARSVDGELQRRAARASRRR